MRSGWPAFVQPNPQARWCNLMPRAPHGHSGTLHYSPVVSVHRTRSAVNKTTDSRAYKPKKKGGQNQPSATVAVHLAPKWKEGDGSVLAAAVGCRLRSSACDSVWFFLAGSGGWVPGIYKVLCTESTGFAGLSQCTPVHVCRGSWSDFAISPLHDRSRQISFAFSPRPRTNAHQLLTAALASYHMPWDCRWCTLLQ